MFGLEKSSKKHFLLSSSLAHCTVGQKRIWHPPTVQAFPLKNMRGVFFQKIMLAPVPALMLAPGSLLVRSALPVAARCFDQLFLTIDYAKVCILSI